MNTDDILRMAREAGAGVYLPPENGLPGTWFGHDFDMLERFAALVRNEALEEAAVKCDSVYYEHLGPEYGEVRYGISASASAIRSMKEVKT